jgi:hypothetical protein
LLFQRGLFPLVFLPIFFSLTLLCRWVRRHT